jgi:hypothetical protein
MSWIRDPLSVKKTYPGSGSGFKKDRIRYTAFYNSAVHGGWWEEGDQGILGVLGSSFYTSICTVLVDFKSSSVFYDGYSLDYSLVLNFCYL